MRILFFDTETNGLWPTVLRLAWQRWETNNLVPTFVDKGDYLIKPSDSIVWDTEAEKIHGISQKHANEYGRLPSEVFPEFVNIVRSVDLIVAHNIQFKKTVILAEMTRLNSRLLMDWWPRFEYCTCEGTKTLCALPPPDGTPIRLNDPYKKPKLTELYKYLFPDTPVEFPFHSTVGDTECLARCFLELLRRRHVPLDLCERSLVRA